MKKARKSKETEKKTDHDKEIEKLREKLKNLHSPNETKTNEEKLHNKIEDMGHTPVLVSKELNNSKPSTLFFLSKLSCKFNRIQFVRDYKDKWNEVDVLITSNPITLENKPSGKTSVKVINKYNSEVDADYTIVDIKELLDSENLLNKILNTSDIKFTEIED